MRFKWNRHAGLIWSGFALVWMAMALPAHALTFLTEENPPLNFTRDGKLTGVSVVVLQELAKRAGVQADMQVVAWSDGLKRAESDPQTCLFSTVRTQERFKRFAWVGPISRGFYSAFALPEFADKLRGWTTSKSTVSGR